MQELLLHWNSYLAARRHQDGRTRSREVTVRQLQRLQYGTFARDMQVADN